MPSDFDMPRLKLYSNSRLPCPQRVLLTAAEKQLDLQIINIDLTTGEHKSAEVSALQPFNAIPVLVDASTEPPFVLYESRAIARYLAGLSDAGTGLVPDCRDSRAVASFEQAASIEVTGFDPIANRLVFEVVFKELYMHEFPDRALVEKLTYELSAKLKILDSILGRQAYMAGGSYSLVDIFYTPYMHHLMGWEGGKALLSEMSHLQRWWASIISRPSYQRMV